MTGLYMHQAGLGHMTGNAGIPSYQGNLRDECVTIAEVLKTAGYTTLMAGKWHVANREDTWPNQRGFDRFYGTPTGGGVYFKDNLKTRGTVFFTLDGNKIDVPEDWYVTDAFTDHATQFIEEAAQKDKPFFLYLAHIAPHWPLQAKSKDIDKYRDRYHTGWDVLRTQRHKRLIDEGLIDPSIKLSERSKESPAWASLPEAKRQDLALRMAVYAAQIDCLDQGIGRLVETLKKTGRYDNTLILFLSDNGSSAEQVNRGGIPGRRVDEPGSYFSAGLPWANAANTPFRKYKMWTHEGGIASPLIAHWPAGIDASRHGKIANDPAHVIDIMATCLDISGATYPKQSRGATVTPIEGVSLKPVFHGDALQRSAPLFWEHQGNRAIRDGRWKLVAAHKQPWSLYDLQTDRTETHDLADQHPDRVKAMAATWDAWAARVGVEPYPVKKAKK